MSMIALAEHLHIGRHGIGRSLLLIGAVTRRARMANDKGDQP